MSLTIDEGHLDSERDTQRAEAKRDLAGKITGQHRVRFSDSLAFGRASGLGNLTSHHQVYLSDGQAQDVEDASVGKVEGPDNRLTMVGGWGGVRRVEEHPVLAQQGIQLFTQTSSSPSTMII